MPVGLDRQSRVMQEMLPPRDLFVSVAAAYSMLAGDHLVLIAAGGAYSVTLPPVAEARGQIYVLRVISGTSTVTVVDKGDAVVAVSDTMNAANEVTVLYSDGQMWHFFITPPA